MAKILLAEDDLFLRDIYKETLSNEGYELAVAVDGKQAYDAILVGGWDLVLLDVIMPKMNGADVLKQLRSKSPKTLAKHIVFLTNSDIDEELKEVLDLADGYLMKSSFTPQQFISEVKQYLNK